MPLSAPAPARRTRTRSILGASVARGSAILSLLLVPAAAPAQEGAAAPETAPRLTLERLYSLPHVVGTAPRGFAWSPDGRLVAFLWNDEGLNFRDVWVVDAADPAGRPRRVTLMPPIEARPSDPGDPSSVAEAEERRERDPGVTSVVWHPDGRRILATFRGDLWLVAEGAEPHRLTSTPAPELSPAYAPDGRSLAFLREGDVWWLPAEPPAEGGGAPDAGGRLTRLAAGDDGPAVRVSSFRWSPDGTRLAVLETDEREVALRGIPHYLGEETELEWIRRPFLGEPVGRERLGVVAAPGTPLHDATRASPGDPGAGAREIRWVDLDAVPEGGGAPDVLLGYRWAPGGRRLAIDGSDLLAKDRRIYVVDTGATAADAAPAAHVVVREREPLNVSQYYWRIAWSRDGERLYFLSDREEDYHVWWVEPPRPDEKRPATPPARRLTRGSWAVADMFPVDGGLAIVANRGRPEERHLFFVSEGGSEPVRLSVRPGTHDPVLSPDGRLAAVAFSSDDTPPELLITSLDASAAADGRERRVTHSPLPEFDAYRWARPAYVTFESHVDGVTLHGRLTLPPDFDPERRYPAILGSVYTETVRNQWGGRTAHPTWGLDQYLAREGYVLLNVDVRGSWGRGRDFRRGIRLDYGGIDVDDLESGVRYLTTLGYVDTDRVGLWGSSYGGLMTVMSLFRKPGLYAAGVAGAPATSVWHALPGQMAVMLGPGDEPGAYEDSSAFLHAHGLRDPLLVIHGTRDRIVLFKDTATLVRRLVLLGKDVDLVALPGSRHGWDTEGLAQTRFAFRKLVRHFDRYLKGVPE